jgi:hypothetical protein
MNGVLSLLSFLVGYATKIPFKKSSSYFNTTRPPVVTSFDKD